MYCLIDAAGHSGDYVTVWDVTEDRKKAIAMNLKGGRSVCVLADVAGHHKGDKIPSKVVSDMISSGRWKEL